MAKKVHTKEFKLGAVKMVVEQEMRVSQVARDLGIASSSVSTWVNNYKKHGGGAFPGKGFLAPQDQEKRDLEKQVRRLTMERDLLKKTMGLFVEHDRKSL